MNIDNNKFSLLERFSNPRSLSPSRKKSLMIFASFSWGIILVILFYQGWKNWDQIVPLLLNAQVSQLVMAVVYYLVNLIAAMVGWITIIRTFDHNLGWWKHTQIFSSTFAARRLPGTFWYVGGRVLLYQKFNIRKTSALFASAIELAVSIFTAGLVGTSLFFIIDVKFPEALKFLIIGISLLGLFIIHPAILSILFRKMDVNYLMTAKTKDWLLWIVSFIVMWITGGLMVAQMVKVLQPVLLLEDVLYVIAAWSLSATAGLITFFLPSSFGATEFSLMALLTKLLPLTLAGTIAFATRLFTMLMEILLSLIFYPFVIRFSGEIRNSKTDSTEMLNTEQGSNIQQE